MLKFLFMMVFMIPLNFKNKFWVNQLLYFMMMILFMLNLSFNYLWMNISYFFGCDLLSYGLILLSIWICSLMLMGSESIYKKKNFMNLFMFMNINIFFCSRSHLYLIKTQARSPNY